MKFIMQLLIVILLLGCDDSNDEIDNRESLSNQEIENLQFLKEEEKLARDVYLYSFDLYNQNIFKNISNSEQSHMNSVTVIMNKYIFKIYRLKKEENFLMNYCKNYMII